MLPAKQTSGGTLVKYMFLLFNEERMEEYSADSLAPWMEFGQKSATMAKQVAGDALQPSTTATVLSVRDGKRVTTDGPFVETKEQLGGYYVFDCENLDVALDIAAMIPWAPTGHIEVRPVMSFE
jgi:hypothetical protein